MQSGKRQVRKRANLLQNIWHGQKRKLLRVSKASFLFSQGCLLYIGLKSASNEKENGSNAILWLMILSTVYLLLHIGMVIILGTKVMFRKVYSFMTSTELRFKTWNFHSNKREPVSLETIKTEIARNGYQPLTEKQSLQLGYSVPSQSPLLSRRQRLVEQRTLDQNWIPSDKFEKVMRNQASKSPTVCMAFRDRPYVKVLQAVHVLHLPLSVMIVNLSGNLNVSSIFRTAMLTGCNRASMVGCHRIDSRACVGANRYLMIDKIPAMESVPAYLQTHNMVPVLIEQGGESLEHSGAMPRLIRQLQSTKKNACLILGSESEGITERFKQILVPMKPLLLSISQSGVFQSYNVAVAAGIALHSFQTAFQKQSLYFNS